MKLSVLFGRLVRRSGRPNVISTVPTPEDWPVSLKAPKRPRKRGVPPKSYAKELDEYRREMRARFADLAAYRRRRAINIGIEKYKWVRVLEAGFCGVADRNNGRIFFYARPPKEGHPAEGICEAEDWCRCLAKPVIEGFD